MTHVLALHAVTYVATGQHLDVLAADPTLDPIKNLILKLLGSAFVAMLAFRLFKHWATTSWPMIFAEIALAVIISWFVITPDSAMAELANLRTQVFGA